MDIISVSLIVLFSTILYVYLIYFFHSYFSERIGNINSYKELCSFDQSIYQKVSAKVVSMSFGELPLFHGFTKSDLAKKLSKPIELVSDEDIVSFKQEVMDNSTINRLYGEIQISYSYNYNDEDYVGMTISSLPSEKKDKLIFDRLNIGDSISCYVLKSSPDISELRKVSASEIEEITSSVYIAFFSKLFILTIIYSASVFYSVSLLK